MKKRPFILMEALIAVALLVLFVFPLVSEPLFSYQKMRKKLFRLEREREVERIYYSILKKPLIFEKITSSYSTRYSLPPLDISIEGLGRKTYTPHYHLYHCTPEKHTSPYYKIWVGVCFKECPSNKPKFDYKFVFLGKVVDQKSLNSHGSDKEAVVKNERSVSDIQTICEDEPKSH